MGDDVWTPWMPPEDPRFLDGVITLEDEHGYLIESADCGRRCPGCGLCCYAYRDKSGREGTQEFPMNLWAWEEDLVPMENGAFYRPVLCGTSCPGYGRCCPPLELRDLPETEEDAVTILQNAERSQRWDLEAALMLLAHLGTPEAALALEAYLADAHPKMQIYAEFAWDEALSLLPEPFVSQRRGRLLRENVLWAWEERLEDRQYIIEQQILPELRQRHYEIKIMQRILAKVESPEERELWEAELADLYDHIAMLERDLESFEEEIALCETMIEAIEEDLAQFGRTQGRQKDPGIEDSRFSAEGGF
ncbi:MAG: hypothetical protein ACP5HM_00680 [Anaerolineae bacterium]